MKYILIMALLFALPLFAVDSGDIRFLLDKEQFDILKKHESYIESLADGSLEDLQLALEYAQRSEEEELALLCHKKLALGHHSLKDALTWLKMAKDAGADSLAFEEMQEQVKREFPAEADRIILDYYLLGTPEEEYLEQIRLLEDYNPLIEELAKSWMDEISVERSDTLAVAMLDRFEHHFPRSRWMQMAYYYRLYHLSQAEMFEDMRSLIREKGDSSSEFQYISSLYLMSPTYRKTLSTQENTLLLEETVALLDPALENAGSGESHKVLYREYSPADWESTLELARVKAHYYLFLSTRGLHGDEEDLFALASRPDTLLTTLMQEIQGINFPDNDRGELAELHYWRGRIQALYGNHKSLEAAARNFTQALVLGAPRKKYDEPCLQALVVIKEKLGVEKELMQWCRKLAGYEGIIFEEHPFGEKRHTRVAIGDYDNDGYNDLLFNGKFLYHNDAGREFTAVTDTTSLDRLNSTGGLWADFNRDGKLDFVATSLAADGNGEALMKNQDGKRFVKVNERAGNIDDGYPTEGAAWIDTELLAYPDLYLANYEKWQVQQGYPDLFWQNRGGYFTDSSKSLGFWTPDYADEPGLAGRGVSPADFDNDGQQEILVTNYRLNRNFCWDLSDTLYVDVAALHGLAGDYTDGYYGHSIGADWGDYDNDGDLDLFIANLAHPRYIEFSDVSQLLRNDGPSIRVVGADTLHFIQFTDVTREAGITYDELHSDPLWLDVDNDGFLDLFITSVYANDRSYLYRNNADGTFSDITFLSGARIYNGWGNATADLDRDGLTDLVVGSGNGTKILLNRTPTQNQSLFVKPIWKNNRIVLVDEPHNYYRFPNSPAFGTRVVVELRSPDGSRYRLFRELSSAKGTTSQNSQELHFGLGQSKVLSIERVDYEKDQD